MSEQDICDICGWLGNKFHSSNKDFAYQTLPHSQCCPGSFFIVRPLLLPRFVVSNRKKSKHYLNIATGETSQAITPFHFFDYFHFFDNFHFYDNIHFFDYFHFFYFFHFFDNFHFFDYFHFFAYLHFSLGPFYRQIFCS